MTAIACLGGHLNRKSDRPPGTKVIWRGFSTLANFTESYFGANQNIIKTCGYLKDQRRGYVLHQGLRDTLAGVLGGTLQ